jgi:hypothetical protein
MEATMFTNSKRRILSIAAIVALAAPAGASARIPFNPSPVAATAETISLPQPAESRESGFQWEDAGVGAAGMLAVLGLAGVSSTLVRRRRPGAVS